MFIIYSCGQSWLDTYKLAYLKLKKDGDPLLRESWVKGESPIFEGTEDVYGVGHACFTTSPDDKENYILYHSKKDKVPIGIYDYKNLLLIKKECLTLESRNL